MNPLLVLLACCPEGPSGDDSAAATPPCVEDFRARWPGAIAVGDDASVETIEAALAGAVPGDVFAIAPGTYTGEHKVEVPDVTLVGACPEATTLDAEDAPGSLWVAAAGVRVQGLSVTGGLAYGIFGNATDLVIEDVVVQDTTMWGIALAAIDATISRVEVTGNQCGSGGTNVCIALNLTGTRATVTDAFIHDNDGYGIYISDGASVQIDDATITGHIPAGALSKGTGLAAIGATLTLGDGVVVAANLGAGLFQEGGTLRIEGDVQFHDHQCISGVPCGAATAQDCDDVYVGSGVTFAGNSGGGLLVSGTTNVVVQGATFTGNGLDGVTPSLWIVDSGALDLRDTGVDGAGSLGIATEYTPGAWSDVTVDHATGAGVAIRFGVETATTLERVTVTGTLRSGEEADGIGFYLYESAITMTDVRADENDDYGVIAFQTQLLAVRLRSVGNESAAVWLLASPATLTDSTISSTAPSTERGWGGYGLVASRTRAGAENFYELPPFEAPFISIVNGTFHDNAAAAVVLTDGLDAEVTGGTFQSNGGDAFLAIDSSLALSSTESSGNGGATALLDGSTGSIGGIVSDDAFGVVQQRCDGVALLDVSAQDAADIAGGITLCSGAPLPVVWSTPALNDDVPVTD